jgi:exosortase/archaeosortase family protein
MSKQQQLFIFRYIAFAVAFYLLIDLSFFKELFHINAIYTDFATYLSHKTALLLHLDVVREANRLTLDQFTIVVLFGCSGLEALLIFYAGVFAYSASLKLKALWLVLGTLILVVFNTLRIVFLLLFGVYDREFFDLMHIYVTQSIMLFVAIGLFLFFVIKANESAKE